MSSHAMWKTIHLLHVHGPTISRAALRKADITCDPDTIGPLVTSGVLEVEPPSAAWHNAKAFRLSQAALGVLQNCLVVDRREVWSHMYVDEPRAFVVMIRPAVIAAGLTCVRGDRIPGSGNRTGNVLRELLSAGFVIADVSVPNPNVDYELGIAKALGRESVLLKQRSTVLPAESGWSPLL